MIVADVMMMWWLFLLYSELIEALMIFYVIYLQGDIPAACECFEKLLALEPNNYETLKILGSLYGRLPGQRAKSIQYLRQVTTLSPDDVEAWLELAEFLEGTDLNESLKG